jgi:hypothetical protein
LAWIADSPYQPALILFHLFTGTILSAKQTADEICIRITNFFSEV